MTDRIEQLRQRMAQESVDLLVLGPGPHLAWAADFRPHADERPLLLGISQTGAELLMPALEAESARQQTDIKMYEWADHEGPGEAFRAMLVALGATAPRTVALDETMRADFAALVTDALPDAARIFSASTVGALRMRKDADEYTRLKANAQTADTAMQAAWDAMRPGMTELEVAQIVRDSFTGQGVTPVFNIIGAGGNGAYPHHHTGDTVIQPGDAVVMDIGGTRDGVFSDITRMAVIGEAPEGFEEAHRLVNDAVEAALAAAKPGAIAREVDAAARSVIAEAGFGEFFIHRTGHGLGTEVHEPPYITATSDEILDEGMVFSIEPGIYLPGRFGLRLEEIVILRENGPEILSDLPRDTRMIDA